MLISFFLFFLLLTLLYFLCRKITSFFYSFFYLITKSEKASVGLLAFFLLPGTLIHELSHFFMATLLRVPTGKLTIWPTLEGKGIIKTGRLELAQTDPFRRTLIGLSPLIAGLSLIYLTGKYLFPYLVTLTTDYRLLTAVIMLFAICYLLFTISTTMFSSRKDLESLTVAGPVLFLFFLALQFVGIKIFLEEKFVGEINLFISNLNFYLLIANIIDYLIFFLLAVVFFLWRKISSMI